jgi:hypothetical protein
VPDYFSQAHHRQSFHGIQAETPRLDHAWTANAFENRIGKSLKDGLDKAGPDVVAGSLTCNDAKMKWV